MHKILTTFLIISFAQIPRRKIAGSKDLYFLKTFKLRFQIILQKLYISLNLHLLRQSNSLLGSFIMLDINF